MQRTRLYAIALLALVVASCIASSTTQRASVLEFLFPDGSDAIPPTDVRLELPLRVGLAFAPSSTERYDRLPEAQKQELLKRVADAFLDEAGVEGIDVIPSTRLQPKGGFENLQQLRSMYGVDLVALVSYEQSQYNEQNKASLTYWTIVGAYFVSGEDTDTHTFVDTTVFDISSRALLFSASGTSRIQESSTPIDVGSDLREQSREGFEAAIDDMIAQLDETLLQFREQARTGTVRGRGTPAIEVVGGSAGVGVGGFGILEGVATLVLGAVGLLVAGARRKEAVA